MTTIRDMAAEVDEINDCLRELDESRKEIEQAREGLQQARADLASRIVDHLSGDPPLGGPPNTGPTNGGLDDELGSLAPSGYHRSPPAPRLPVSLPTTIRELAEVAGMSVTSARSRLEALVDQGVLRVERRNGRGGNRYDLRGA